MPASAFADLAKAVPGYVVRAIVGDHYRRAAPTPPPPKGLVESLVREIQALMELHGLAEIVKLGCRDLVRQFIVANSSQYSQNRKSHESEGTNTKKYICNRAMQT
jgi:hypothetical protein